MTLLLDHLVAVMLKESARERRRWFLAHARAVQARWRERRPPAPPRWTYAVVVGGKVTYHA